MTPDQLEIAAAFERLTFEDSRCKDAVFVRAIAKLAKRTPTAELNDGQDKSLRDIVDRYRRQFPVGFVIKHGRRLSKTIQWMAPDLAKAGLINDEAWRADHAARIVGLFPHKSMHQVASIFAAIHPVAADFIEKAPVWSCSLRKGPVGASMPNGTRPAANGSCDWNKPPKGWTCPWTRTATCSRNHSM
jgi:hypothetical protein